MWPSAQWWQGFNSPQLDALLAAARIANDDIAAAVARVSEADAQTRIAGAPLLPTLVADSAATRQRQRSSTGDRAGSTNAFNVFSAQVGASYQIDFWGKYHAIQRAARLAQMASSYDRATVELTVMAGVASTYFQVLALRDRLKVAGLNLGRAQEVLDGLKLEHDVGVVTGLEVAQQEETVATLEATVPPLRQQLRQSLDALATLTGQLPQAITIDSGALTDLAEPHVEPGLPSQLLARRPDVARAEAQLVAANADIAAARAAFFPSIDITASGGYASDALEALFNPVSRVFALAGGVTQPLFQGGSLAGRYALSKARYAELLASYHKAVISAFANVEDALAALQQTAEQQRRQQRAVASARRAYELSQAQLHGGTVNVLTVLNTESALFAAEDALVQVRFAHFQALIALFSALGGGWQQA